MREELKNRADWVDALDNKLFKAFPGRVVRKDLVKRFKAGDNIPVYVLEYLLGKYCSTTDEREIEEGIQRVKDVISERIVRADRGELIKSTLKKRGVHKLIDLVTVKFDEKDEGGKYWAGLAAARQGAAQAHGGHRVRKGQSILYRQANRGRVFCRLPRTGKYSAYSRHAAAAGGHFYHRL